MGDRWKIWRCFCISSTGTQSDNGQPQPTSPSQASTSNPCPRLEFTAKEIADFQKILDCVQEVVHKYKDKVDSKVIPQEVINILKSSSNDGERVLVQVSNALDEKKSTTKDIVAEARTIVPTILRGLGTLDWAAAGISLIAFAVSEIYNRADGMHENLKDILDILEDLGKLGKHVVELLSKRLYDGNDTLKEATFLICGGVIWCDKQLQEGRVKRFASVNITKDNIEDLKTQIIKVYNQLNLGVGIQAVKDVKNMSRQITKPLAPHKLEYPAKKVGLEEKVDDILHRLGVEGDSIQTGVRGILLHGIGGIGKTTLGYATCARIPIAQGFVAQVELGENPTTEKICKLQMDIRTRLCEQKQSIGSCEEGQEVLHKYFSQCSSPILLFIDNVFKEQDLSKLLPSGLRLPDKSRVIITSRHRGVSKALNKDIACELYPMQELCEADSEMLFYEHLGECPQNRKEQVDTILKICGGLPLALELVG